MPELPEVETIVQQLHKKVKDKTITKIEILDPKVVSAKIKQSLNKKIKNVYRRGKIIIVELSDKNYLTFHLRMTGHFHYYTNGKHPTSEAKLFSKFVVAKFYLSDGSILTHNSIRKFGSVKLMDQKELEKESSKLGPEPLSKEFTLQKFAEILSKKPKSNLKTFLMDQSQIAGIGNIYAQEALYLAGINPNRKCNDISEKEIKKLYHELLKLLTLAISKHGTTVENYTHIEGSGGFQKYLTVYGKNKCPKGHLIKKIYLGQRGTSYCEVCQK
ncbi:MAG: DNA-formamidopyrimidine glycosylase [Candidatus Woesearchaeota archaeon]